MTTKTIQTAAFEITDAPALDPIRVITQDIAPGRGRIIIECFGQAWAGFWGAMGEKKVLDFFRSCDPEYLANAMRCNIQSRKVKTDEYLIRIIKAVKEMVTQEDATKAEREADRKAGIRRCIDCGSAVGECECN